MTATETNVPVADISESVVAADIKTIAGQPDSLANLALQNAVAFSQAANQAMLDSMNGHRTFDRAVNGALVKNLLEIDPMEALSWVKGSTGNDIAQVLSTLGAAVAQIQQLMKGAQSTPPETAKPG